jgi:hypothetical protein
LHVNKPETKMQALSISRRRVGQNGGLAWTFALAVAQVPCTRNRSFRRNRENRCNIREITTLESHSYVLFAATWSRLAISYQTFLQSVVANLNPSWHFFKWDLMLAWTLEHKILIL